MAQEHMNQLGCYSMAAIFGQVLQLKGAERSRAEEDERSYYKIGIITGRREEIGFCSVWKSDWLLVVWIVKGLTSRVLRGIFFALDFAISVIGWKTLEVGFCCLGDINNSGFVGSFELLALGAKSSVIGRVYGSNWIKEEQVNKLDKFCGKEFYATNCSREIEKMLGQCNYNQHSASATTHKSRKSKRWRTVCEQQTAEASHSFCGNDEQNSAVMANEDLLVGTASHIDNSIMGDIGNSELSKFPSISDLGKIEKMLTQCDHNQNSASETTHKSRKSKRWRTVTAPAELVMD
ncbi:hypothetical protein ABKV19_022787 [Rosa sericea]